MLRKFLTYFICFSMALCLPSYAEDIDDDEDSYETVGICATQGVSDGVGFSMMGWGIAFVVTISILAVVLNQSLGSTAHNPSSS